MWAIWLISSSMILSVIWLNGTTQAQYTPDRVKKVQNCWRLNVDVKDFRSHLESFPRRWKLKGLEAKVLRIRIDKDKGSADSRKVEEEKTISVWTSWQWKQARKALGIIYENVILLKFQFFYFPVPSALYFMFRYSLNCDEGLPWIELFLYYKETFMYIMTHSAHFYF